MIVKEGIASVNGMISSIKENIPPILPILPLYSLVIWYAETGAQTTSENSPIKGIVNDNIPIASKRIPSTRLRILLAARTSTVAFLITLL